MKQTERDRRDWSLLIFVVPLGILLMMIAGQLALRIIPQWIVNAGMGSELSLTGQPMPIPLFNIQILTPFAWQDTYLTPGSDGGFVFPPFLVIEPTIISTALPTDAIGGVITTPATTPIIPIPTLPRSTATVYIPPPQTTVASGSTNAVTATNNVIYTSTNTSTGTATATPTTTSTPTPTATATGYPPPSTGEIPPPPEIGSAPDDSIGLIPSGSYTLLDISANPVVVSSAPDGNYEIIFYEFFNLDAVYIDKIIVGIISDSNLNDGYVYYPVFNWGDSISDFNTNVDYTILDILIPDPACPLEPECDNRRVTTDYLYPYPGTGVEIDVDTPPDPPPTGTYNYIIIIAPVGGGDPAQIDAIAITGL